MKSPAPNWNIRIDRPMPRRMVDLVVELNSAPHPLLRTVQNAITLECRNLRKAVTTHSPTQQSHADNLAQYVTTLTKLHNTLRTTQAQLTARSQNAPAPTVTPLQLWRSIPTTISATYLATLSATTRKQWRASTHGPLWAMACALGQQPIVHRDLNIQPATALPTPLPNNTVFYLADQDCTWIMAQFPALTDFQIPIPNTLTPRVTCKASQLVVVQLVPDQLPIAWTWKRTKKGYAPNEVNPPRLPFLDTLFSKHP